jgi:Mor family transcriptional regulator
MVTQIFRKPNLEALQSVEHTDDVVEYTLRCVLALAPTLSEAVVRAADEHVRELFGGDEVWVGKRKDLATRNASIMRDYLAGERVGLLSRRYGISERHVIRVVKGVG